MLAWMMRLKDSIKANTNTFFACVFSAGFFGLAGVLPIFKNTLSKAYAITDFSAHVMSQSTLSNSDIGIRIRWYYLMMLAIVAVAVLGTLLFFRLLKGLKRSEENKKAILFVKHTAILGSLSLIAALLAAYAAEEMVMVAAIFAVPLVLGLLYLCLEKNQHRDFDLMFLSLSLSVVLMVFVGAFMMQLSLSDTVNTLLLLACGSALSLGLFLLFQTRLSKQKNKIIVAGIPLLFTAIAQVVGLETLNIINKRFNIALNIQYEMYLGIMAAAVLLGVALWMTTKKTKQSIKVDHLYLPIALLTLGMIIGQPSRTLAIRSEFFEYANHGLGVDHLFRYGSIPVIENFDAHMLSSQVFGYLAQVLNGYEPWTVGLYGGAYTAIYYVLAFAFLKRVLNERTAFVFVLGFPLLRMLIHPTFIMAMLMVIALDNLVRSDSVKNRIWFAVVCLVLCLYRLDVGFVSVLAGIAAYVLVYIKRGEGRRIFSLIITGVSTILIFGAVYLAVCFVRDIPPLARLREMMMAAGSNQNWAYFQTGDRFQFIYNWAYFAMPLSMAAVILVFAFRYFTAQRREVYSKPAIAVFLFLAVFYYINLSRGIVRHSLAEENMVWFIFGTYFSALLALSAVRKQGLFRIVGFSVGLIAFMLIIGTAYPSISRTANIVHSSNGSYSLVSNAYASKNYAEQYTKAEPMNGSRLTGENIPQVAEFKAILDTVLRDDETYVDLASMDYFYALTERKNPNYVNQMPMMINGDGMQKMAIREIEEAKVPLAILPISMDDDIGYGTSIDSMMTDYKYYLLFEYVYANYQPLVRLDGFDVYARTDRWEAFSAKLSEGYSLMSGYDKTTQRKLGYIPLLWAEEMGPQAGDLEKTAEIVGADSSYVETLITTGQPANLLLEISAAADTQAVVSLEVDGQEVGTFAFLVKAGTNRYAVRVSVDCGYWTEGLRTWSLTAEETMTLSGYALTDDEGSRLEPED